MAVTQVNLFKDEEKLKEKVYGELDRRKEEAAGDVNSAKKTLDHGAFEEQDSFIPNSQLSGAKEKRHKTERLVGMLYDRPYFAHVRVKYDGDGYEDDYFLSDCETLDESVTIKNGGVLLPFKQDEKRPISGALFSCYQAKNGKRASYKVNDEVFSFIAQLICDTDIESRVLRNVNQYYPRPETTQVTADELLASRLDENRSDPSLRNIISTLQLQQFEIIGSDVNESFVVQGCAGSGKSQCLIHRLFYFRAVLAKDGWDKVLLITPSKLFRHYSSGLMKRYQLTSINDCSISDLYIELLGNYDDRFMDRQYVFQTTEEYLPDGYLHEIYDENNVQGIESEIDKAINGYVKSGCDALGIKAPAKISSSVISDIVKALDEAIAVFDEREKSLQENEEYQNKRAEYEKLVKSLDSTQRKLQRNKDELIRNINNQEELSKAIQSLEDIEKEKQEWIDLREKQVSNAIAELEAISRKVDRGTDLQAPAKYAKQIYIVKDLTEGNGYSSYLEELEYYDELIGLANNEIQDITRDKRPKNAITRYKKRQEEINDNIKNLGVEVEEISTKIEEYAEWLRNAANEYDGQEAKSTLLRSEMQQSRYFLSRIENTVFEKEVWNALAPVKEKYSIQTMEIEELADGKRKESRILYKADLLFYIRIYMKLHPSFSLPQFNLICIDEGQDLHRADYDILHGLYPKAVFNVFGDVDQVLHASCGISNWKTQTGIEQVYPLETNYRNTAAIVDFCNKQFGVKMNYLGKVMKSQKPIVISDWSEARKVIENKDLVIIVKDRESFDKLCKNTGIESDEIVYLDTTSEKPEEDVKECYSIYAAKGLEFPEVFVYANEMTKNQKVVACTRAMGGLYYYE